MSGGAAIHACSLVLAHAPDLVRHGSKPTREIAADARRAARLASRRASARYDDALGYPPHQALRRQPPARGALGDRAAPGGATRRARARKARTASIVDQDELYRRMAEADAFQLFRLDGERGARRGASARRGGPPAGSMLAPTTSTRASRRSVLLENLACKATGALALEHLLRTTGLAAEDVRYVIGCGEEAVGDRYQRGGGNLGEGDGRAGRVPNASGSDVKAFCCGPVHALVLAAGLVAAGIYTHVVVVAGGSLAKLGMKFRARIEARDADPGGRARRLRRARRPRRRRARAAARRGRSPRGRVRLGAAGRARGARRRAARAARPRHARRRSLRDRAAQPRDHRAGRGGNVPSRNYRLIGALAVKPRRAAARGARRLRAQARPAGLLADAGPHRLGGAVAPARARGAARRRDRLDDARREGVALPRAHDRAGRRDVHPPRTGKGVAMPVEATVETFTDLTSEGSVLVDFWGPRCQPCLAMMPTIAELEQEAGGAVRVVKVTPPRTARSAGSCASSGCRPTCSCVTGRSSSASPATCPRTTSSGLSRRSPNRRR